MYDRFTEKNIPGQRLPVFADDGSLGWEQDYRINVAPGMKLPILVRDDEQLVLMPAKWGLIPSW
ncbi:MAG: hypothetical protein CVV45_00670 [Spirochaetae bacterium HGW-Spirochaetae-10]|nr:MAG: hypothetical protein CVV45_00670 [Spirochaetae bacterium HGW-Spirochaetae-10]